MQLSPATPDHSTSRRRNSLQHVLTKSNTSPRNQFPHRTTFYFVVPHEKQSAPESFSGLSKKQKACGSENSCRDFVSVLALISAQKTLAWSSRRIPVRFL